VHRRQGAAKPSDTTAASRQVPLAFRSRDPVLRAPEPDRRRLEEKPPFPAPSKLSVKPDSNRLTGKTPYKSAANFPGERSHVSSDQRKIAVHPALSRRDRDCNLGISMEMESLRDSNSQYARALIQHRPTSSLPQIGQVRAGRTMAWVGCILTLLLPLSQGLAGHPWLEDGHSCFCLRHKQDQIIRNCIGVRGKGDPHVTAICSGSEPGDRPSKLTVQPPWTPIQSGAAGCSPCQPGPRETKEVPRGGEH
jgi:hypothetical protein